MKKNTATIVVGILFGIALIPVAYLNLVIGVALAFAKNDWFIYSGFIYFVLGIITIVGAALARRKIKATRIILLIPNIINVALITYLAIFGAFAANLILLIPYLLIFALGITAQILSFVESKN